MDRVVYDLLDEKTLPEYLTKESMAVSLFPPILQLEVAEGDN